MDSTWGRNRGPKRITPADDRANRADDAIADIHLTSHCRTTVPFYFRLNDWSESLRRVAAPILSCVPSRSTDSASPRESHLALDIRVKSRLFAAALSVLPIQAGAANLLAEKAWNHGSADCANANNPAIEILEVDAASYILRQDKCVHVEAPFIYVLFGETSVFVQDTGATADPGRFPLYDTVQALIARRGGKQPRILVTHSHNHGDHTAADAQFRGKPGVTLIEPNAAAMRAYFGFSDWPAGQALIDLGGRTLTVIPTPGHQDDGIAIYDAQTDWLLTGDSLYPGRLTIKNWNEYRSSIARLAQFASANPISAVLGTHIEMSRTGQLYPPGSRFQPDEANLALTGEDLSILNASLQAAGTKPKEIVLARAVVAPIGATQRVLGGILKSLGVR